SLDLEIRSRGSERIISGHLLGAAHVTQPVERLTWRAALHGLQVATAPPLGNRALGHAHSLSGGLPENVRFPIWAWVWEQQQGNHPLPVHTEPPPRVSLNGGTLRPS